MMLNHRCKKIMQNKYIFRLLTRMLSSCFAQILSTSMFLGSKRVATTHDKVICCLFL